jgi:hypothetical protein
LRILTSNLAYAATLIALAGGAPMAIAPSHAFELEPGTWKQIEIGTEDGKWVPPGTSTSCLTPEQAQDPRQGLAPDKDLTEMRGQCRTLDVQKSDTSLTIHVQCGDPGKVLKDFRVDYTFNNARSYSGRVKSAVTVSGKSATTDKKVEGRWMSSDLRSQKCPPAAGIKAKAVLPTG